MRKKFLGFICFLYTSIIIYVLLSGSIKNYLAPQMQIYLKLSILPLFIMGVVLYSIKKDKDEFKVSDLILILPIILLFISGDGRLTMTLARNRINNYNDRKNNDVIEEERVVRLEEISEEDIDNVDNSSNYDFSNTYFDVSDSTYDGLANYITYVAKSDTYEGKTIRVRGFTVTEEEYIPNGYFAIGKYSISCCAADATFIGFIGKNKKIKNNTWYEIEGVLVKDKDNLGYDILAIDVINIKEIDGNSEEQYVYPCYAYDDGSCKDMQKYNLEY